MRALVIGVAVVVVVANASAGAADSGARDYGPWIEAYLATREAIFSESKGVRLRAISKLPPVDQTLDGPKAMAQALAPFSLCVTERLKSFSEIYDAKEKDIGAVRDDFFNNIWEICEEIFVSYTMPNIRRIYNDEKLAGGYMIGVTNMYLSIVDAAAKDAFMKAR